MASLPDISTMTSTVKINDGRSYYDRWVAEQNVPVFEGFYIPSIDELPLGPWDRKGARGSFVHLQGTGNINNAYVCEIGPGGSTRADKHLFEEFVYISTGSGATTVRNGQGHEVSFEWQQGSMFSIPLNCTYQHFNGSGTEPARYYAVTSAPLMLNLLHNETILFDLDFDFADRFGPDADFSGSGTGYAGRIWDTNLVADVRKIPLQGWNERGSGSSNVMLELANNSLCAHVSQFPVGTYKKAHRHGPGAHVVILEGEGYTMLWPEGHPIERVDWQPGSVVVPPDMWFHQHFNLSAEPARYLAMRWHSAKHPVFEISQYETSTALGGDQIEYDNEDAVIGDTFAKELATRGLSSAMNGVA